MNAALGASVPLVRLRGRLVPVGTPVPWRALPAGQQWIGHDGKRARLRRLRQHWALIEKEARRNPMVQEAREALLDAVAEDKNPELSAMLLALGAREAVEVLRISWPEAIRAMLAKREAARDEQKRTEAHRDPDAG